MHLLILNLKWQLHNLTPFEAFEVIFKLKAHAEMKTKLI